MRYAEHLPPVDEKVLAKLRAVGTDDVTFGGHVEPMGYFMQQRPSELAQFIAVLNDFGEHRNLLEIGSASGGTLRAICDHVDIGDCLVIDNGQHWNHRHWVRNALKVRTKSGQVPRLIVTDSHSDHAKRCARQWKPYDLILVDGDHTYDGLLQDVVLAMDVAARGGLIALHDIAARNCEEVADVHRTLQGGCYPELEHVCDIVADDEPRFGWALYQYDDA